LAGQVSIVAALEEINSCYFRRN